MGGYVTFSLALRYPARVRGLILMDTRAEADSLEAAQRREKLAQDVTAMGNAIPVIEHMIPRLFARSTFDQHPEKVEEIRQIMSRTSPGGIAAALRGMAQRPDRYDQLPKIDAPTLVIVGEEDVITPPSEAQALSRAIAGARLEVIPNCGHMAPYENPSFTNSVIEGFLDSLA